jgi:osmotically-inducible protein OsmY
MHANPRKTLQLTIVLLLASLLGGCAAAVVGGVVAGASVVHDRRTTGTIIEDKEILLGAMRLREEDAEFEQRGNINIEVYNLQVLLTGQAEDADLVHRFKQRVAALPRVRTVFDEVYIGAESTWSEATADAFLTSKVKLALFQLDIEDFDPTRVEVTSSRGSVYLMGLLTRAEADAVTEKVRYVSGVKRVVRLFEYL